MKRIILKILLQIMTILIKFLFVFKVASSLECKQASLILKKNSLFAETVVSGTGANSGPEKELILDDSKKLAHSGPGRKDPLV